jgi:excisionase family DNA binding protein
MTEEMLTTDEVADRYKIDKQTQSRYRRTLGLPYTRPGKRILYRRSELEAWLDRYRENTQDQQGDRQ